MYRVILQVVELYNPVYVCTSSFMKLTHRVDTYPQLVSNRLSPTCREAMPKSAIRMLFFSSRSKFSGFRSL